ncbi:MAG TPA: hypothetical protein PLR22_02170 [Saprospiraceae bacterium]|nr:hypothetical protein [Saprospiraceae bacterium]
MNRFFLIIITTALFILLSTFAWAQGCSDAGFCTINSLKPNNADGITSFQNQFKIGAYYGAASNSINVYGGYLEYNRFLNNKFSIDAKLTTMAQSGNGISTFGLSDFYVNSTYTASQYFFVTAGVKIPLAKSNKSKDNLPLPMDYQSSLGTFDVILGIGIDIKKLQVTAAFQQPLTANDNQFTTAVYPENSKFQNFQSTNQFKRKGDVLLRIAYPIRLGSKLRITPSILPIYHLSNDLYTDDKNVEQEIIGSKGLTLNGNLFLDYRINDRNNIQINGGMPFIVREARPDGLTRSLIATLEYAIRF